ncbi:MAG TPA: glycoside hydrolase family 15 protein [Albitalea sp.]|nr:glycoside hydrolase family 15 protein [Albitalea sp.]
MTPAPFIDPLPDPRIGDYAAIGDCRTLALVSRFGSIDWYCLPHFSGPSVFAALLDRRRGGRFALIPLDIQSIEQHYLEQSNVLQTRFICRDGVLELTDFMTMRDVPAAADECGSHEIVRIARCLAGEVTLQALLAPRPDYARCVPRLTLDAPGRWRCSGAGVDLQVDTTLPCRRVSDGTLQGLARLRQGESHELILASPVPANATGAAGEALRDIAQASLDATLAWWRSWSARCVYDGPYGEAVIRSCLALKLLNHVPTGAVVAAGTTSIPEADTGDRNWDYRYCWLRDTSLVLQAFIDLGHADEGDAFLRWLLHATRRSRPGLQVVYDVHGNTLLDEQTLPHLSGYHGIGPVRIGNAASRQSQHDVYGEVILTAFDHVQRGGRLDHQEMTLLAGFADAVCRVWREPDHGIWEIRLPPRHNTHSKLMCWAALDRMLALHERLGLPLDAARLARERAAIRADIEAHGFSREVNSYVGHYGSRAADASLLLIPRLRYLDANDPRVQGTVSHVLRQLSVDGLLYRYPPGEKYDGVEGVEHLFAMCSFWCVDCLTRQNRIDDARAMYERLLRLRNHAGLYAEEFGVHDGRPLGNFPQAFSHVGLITAALTMAETRPRPAAGAATARAGELARAATAVPLPGATPP